MGDARPNPDELLKRALSEQELSTRGKLKIYLGMVAGVGKTYAMLSDALNETKRGTRVVAGYIEPHGRVETEDLAKSLPQIPPKTIEYRGVTLREFDLDQALREKPPILLVDEFAHTNAPGSRHLKRYQDIEELCTKGITVWTTLNIQHIESLRDVITNITGVSVQETVPDSVLAEATQIELVDIPPEELLQRLEAGKIYSPEKVDAALRNFFQKGNLVALREIVLRHAADTVDAQLQTFRTAEGVKKVWATNPRVLVTVAPSKFAIRLVHAAIRLASNLKAPLVAVAVESARTRRASAENRIYVEKALQSAERAGAEIIQRSGEDVVGEILRVSQEKNATMIVIGKPMRARWRELLFGSVVTDLIERSGNLDVHVVQGSEEEGTKHPLIITRGRAATVRSISEAILWVTLATAACFLVYPVFALVNLIMIYLLAVSWVAARSGRVEAIVASFLSVLAYDYCFVPPRWTFAVADMQYLVTFAVMLVVALIISSLTLRLKAQSEATSERERRTSTLLNFSKRLSDCRSLEDVARITRETALASLDLESVVFWSEATGKMRPLNNTGIGVEHDINEIAVVQWVSDRKIPAGKSTDTLPGSRGLYLPLDFPGDSVPVWGVYPTPTHIPANQTAMIDGISHLLSGALKRLLLENEATSSQMKAQQEEIRNVLLSSVSHDLRTPLTAICGAASALLGERDLPDRNKQLISTISESATRLSFMVKNVLDLSRLESGGLALNREWHALEELVGTALERTEGVLGGKAVNVKIPKDFPLIMVDGLLVEQLFVNLLENIARHAGSATTIDIRAERVDSEAVIEVSDNGPGLEPGSERSIFEKLVRGKSSQGFGLGLAICKAVAIAHGGSISAYNLPKGGACFKLVLPAHELPPEIGYE